MTFDVFALLLHLELTRGGTFHFIASLLPHYLAKFISISRNNLRGVIGT